MLCCIDLPFLSFPRIQLKLLLVWCKHSERDVGAMFQLTGACHGGYIPQVKNSSCTVRDGFSQPVFAV